MREAFLFVMMCLIIVAAFFVTIGGLVYFLSGIECNAELKARKVAGNFSFWTDCMVEYPNGQVVPLKTYDMTTAIKNGTN